MKQIHLVLYSGLSNRLFVLLSALNIRRTHGHNVYGFWTEKVGRAGLPYVGPVHSDWGDFFEPIEGVHMIPIQGSVAFAREADLDQEQYIPNALHTPQKLSQEAWRFISGPKVVNPARDTLIIKKLTTPFGTDPKTMARYVRYLDKPGQYQKDDYLQDLSSLARQRLRPVPSVQRDIDALRHRFGHFDTVFGIHLRGTDLVRDQATRQAHREAVTQAIQQTIKPDIGFYIASDEPIDWLVEKFPGQILFHDNPRKTENSIEGTRQAIVDLFMLARCRVIKGTPKSSFSMMAWLLSEDADYVL